MPNMVLSPLVPAVRASFHSAVIFIMSYLHRMSSVVCHTLSSIPICLQTWWQAFSGYLVRSWVGWAGRDVHNPLRYEQSFCCSCILMIACSPPSLFEPYTVALAEQHPSLPFWIGGDNASLDGSGYDGESVDISEYHSIVSGLWSCLAQWLDCSY